jgi:hypothetical protein
LEPLEKRVMAVRFATMAPEIEIRVKFIRPEGNKSGSLGILRESEGPARLFRSRHGITTKWLSVTDPATGERLEAFRPIELDQLRYIEEGVGMQDGQIGIATFSAVPFGSRTVWKFHSIRPV